jgi:hypothetical protein
MLPARAVGAGVTSGANLAVLPTGSENHFLGPVITDTKLCSQCRGLQWLAPHRRGSGTKLVPYLRWICAGRALQHAEFCCCAPLKLGVLQEGAFGPWLQCQPGTYFTAGLSWPGACARLTSGLKCRFTRLKLAGGPGTCTGKANCPQDSFRPPLYARDAQVWNPACGAALTGKHLQPGSPSKHCPSRVH